MDALKSFLKKISKLK